MRILVVSNLYPSYHENSAEMNCRDLIQSLKNRQHQVKVLTSDIGRDKERTKGSTLRRSSISSEKTLDWKDVFIKEVVNQTVFKKTCLEFEPNVCFFFDLTHVSLSLYPLAIGMELPVCFYYADNWFVTRERDGWYQLWPKGNKGYRVLRHLTKRFGLLPPQEPFLPTHAIFGSHYLKKLALACGILTSETSIVPCGIEVDRFPFDKRKRQQPNRLLYVGSIDVESGIDDVIKALFLLNHKDGENPISLTITGENNGDSEYELYLKDLADKMGQKDEVKFMGILPQEKRQELYHSHDIFISPSHKDDAYTRSLLEAMSSGMAIVSTWTASKSEFLEERVNAMLYPKGDSDGCADQIQCLSREPLLFESITKNARKTVENSFPLNRTVDSIEQFLFKIAKQAKPVGAPIKTHGDIRLDRLTRRAKRWLILGKCVVFTRILLQPKFFLLIPVKIYKKLIGFTPHFLYKTLFDMCFFWKRRHRQKTASSHRHTQRMLVLQLADIGDVVLTSPFLRELRRCYPEAWISLVVQPGMHNLVEKCPYIDDIIPYDWGPSQKREKYLRGSPLWWIQATGIARKNLWKHPLDTAISNRWNEDPCQAASLILMYTSGASRRVAYRAISSQKMRYGWRDFDRLITEGPVREIPKHEVEQQLDVLRYLGAEPEDTRLEVWISHEDKGFARKVLHESQIDQTNGLIAFAPGAAWVFRRWPAERFIELGKWLQDTYNVSVLIFAAKIEEDLACRVEKGLRKEKTLNLAGKTTLREMAAFFKHCKLFIGNDSGPLHIATAAGIPVIGFYGPGEYHRFKPWGKNQEALRLGLSCSPCSQNCLFDEPRCIRGITFDQVKNLLVQKMSSILDLP